MNIFDIKSTHLDCWFIKLWLLSPEQDGTGSFFGTIRPEPIAAFAPKLAHPAIANPAMAPIKAPYTKCDKNCQKKKY